MDEHENDHKKNLEIIYNHIVNENDCSDIVEILTVMLVSVLKTGMERFIRSKLSKESDFVKEFIKKSAIISIGTITSYQSIREEIGTKLLKDFVAYLYQKYLEETTTIENVNSATKN